MSLSRVPARACVLLVILPLSYLSSGCSFLPSRERVSETVGTVRDVTEERLREKWESTWKPALVAESTSVGKEIAAQLAESFKGMLSAQAQSYAADLEAKVANNTASRTERFVYWALGALGLLGTGKGVAQGGKLKAMLTAVVSGIELARASGQPIAGDSLRDLVKAEAKKLGVDSLLYPLVQAVAAKLK